MQTVTFSPGETAVNFTIPVVFDREFEGIEYFNIKLVMTKSARQRMITLGDLNTATGIIIDEGMYVCVL